MPSSLPDTRRRIAAAAFAFIVGSMVWAVGWVVLNRFYDVLCQTLPVWTADLAAAVAFAVYARFADRWLRLPGRGVRTWAILPTVGAVVLPVPAALTVFALIVLGATGPVSVDSLLMGRLIAIAIGCPVALTLGFALGIRGARRS